MGCLLGIIGLIYAAGLPDVSKKKNKKKADSEAIISQAEVRLEEGEDVDKNVKICPKCGWQIFEEDETCPNCGKKVK